MVPSLAMFVFPLMYCCIQMNQLPPVDHSERDAGGLLKLIRRVSDSVGGRSSEKGTSSRESDKTPSSRGVPNGSIRHKEDGWLNTLETGDELKESTCERDNTNVSIRGRSLLVKSVRHDRCGSCGARQMWIVAHAASCVNDYQAMTRMSCTIAFMSSCTQSTLIESLSISSPVLTPAK